MNDTMRNSIAAGESVFTGSMFGLLGIDLATIFLSVLTFGIAYPWLLCWRQSWYAEHTYINGKRLDFNGTGLQLFGNWIKWIFFVIITFGIYALWIPIKVEQWRVKHTRFAEPIVVNYDAPPEPHKKPIETAKKDDIKRFCTNCGAAINEENTMVDGTYCSNCKPTPASAISSAPTTFIKTDISQKSTGLFKLPSDSDLD